MVVYNYKNFIWGITFLDSKFDPMIEIEMLGGKNELTTKIEKLLPRDSNKSLLVFPETCKDFKEFIKLIKTQEKSDTIFSGNPEIDFFCEDILKYLDIDLVYRVQLK